MKNKSKLKVASILCAVFIFISAGNSFSQSYLPLTGGTLTGNLYLSSGTQLQAPYLGFNSLSTAQPANSNYPALFPNSTAQTFDLVGARYGWQFIPNNSSSYATPVFTINQSGFTQVQGGLYVSHPIEGSGNAYGMQIRNYTQTATNTGSVIGLSINISTFPSSSYNTATARLLDLSGGYGIVAGSGNTITNAQGIIMGTLNAATNNCNLCILDNSTGPTPTGNYSFYNSSRYVNYFNAAVGLATAAPTHTLTFGSTSTGIAAYNTADQTNFVRVREYWAGNVYTFLSEIGGTATTKGNFNFAGGNVLINQATQANSAYVLDVNGSARANALYVNTTGADFVFAPAYRLKPLAAVEKYIDKNHHLPGIAPAKEMQANGLDVGGTETKLLQKIEELTLYLIENDKRLKAQQSEMSAMRQQIKTMAKRLNKKSK